jgi:hypothetical protein
MQLKARLVHAEAGRRVVRVSAWHQGTCLGSALGEAESAEVAEDRAIERLQQRLGATAAAAPLPASAAPAAAAAPISPPPARNSVIRRPSGEASETSTPVEPPPSPELPLLEGLQPEPDDWSDELAALDLHLQRLGWGRDQESTYLQRAFGHPSRSRLTSYGDLNAYLKAVQQLSPDSDPGSAPVPLRRADLLFQCDQMLQQLQWDANQGRAFLDEHFQLASRQQLSDEQLLHFNMLLEAEVFQTH